MFDDFTVAVGKPSTSGDQIHLRKPCCVKADYACFIAGESGKDLEKTRAKFVICVFEENFIENFGHGIAILVPWSRLGQDPRIFLLAEPATQVDECSEDVVHEAKKSLIQETKLKLWENSQQLQSEMNKSWLGSLINTIIGNFKLSISNIHIRYEDSESNPGHPFAAGVSLDKLSVVTVDDGKSAVNSKANVVHIFLVVHMDHNASKLIGEANEPVEELSCENVSCSIKLYPETKVFYIKLGSYQLLSPKGLLVESATSNDSLVGVFNCKPFDDKVDWSMVAKASPCYMTYI